ncbi:MAG: hypothetical protein PHV06_06795 [bacterium]|nr:hypothetical protein [bacterium]
MENKPDFENMNVYEMGKYYFDLGEYKKAKGIIEECIKKYQVSDINTFDLMLSCCIKLEQKDEYLRIHKEYSLISGLHEPDLKYLDRYLPVIEDGLFIIHGKNKKGKKFFGTGFSISQNSILAFNKLIEGVEPGEILITGKFRTIGVKEIIYNKDENFIELIADDLLKKTIHFGHPEFTELGENIVLPGFIKKAPLNFINCLSILKASIEKIEKDSSFESPIFILDKKIKPGFTGSPVINYLGSVIGVITGEITKENKSAVLPFTVDR